MGRVLRAVSAASSKSTSPLFSPARTAAMEPWQWLAAVGGVGCVAAVLLLGCFVLCRRSSSSYEVSKAVMNQAAVPPGGNEFYV
ncbi:hypothetical protein Aduo_002008 [Ancylostoma duodenale]